MRPPSPDRQGRRYSRSHSRRRSRTRRSRSRHRLQSRYRFPSRYRSYLWRRSRSRSPDRRYRHRSGSWAPEATGSRPTPIVVEEGPPASINAVHPPVNEAPQQPTEPPQDALVPGLSSSSSPDEAVAGVSSSGPPPIDLRAHQDLFKWVAQNINLPVEEVAEDDDPVVNIIGVDAPLHVALPFIRTIQRNVDTVWQSPASIPPTARGVERKYSVPSKGYEYLYTDPAPCSLVVQSVNDRERHGQRAPAPKSKEARRMDLSGRKVYSAGGLQLRVANQLTLLSRYTYDTLVSLSKFSEFVPSDSRPEFTALVEEGKKASRLALQASLDSADSGARTLASGVTMRRISWLQASTLPLEVQHTIQDLPFDGQGLFSEKTDSRLQTLKDGRVTIRSLGMHTPVTQRRSFRPQPYRLFSQPRPQPDNRRRGRVNRRRQSGNQGNQSQAPSKPPSGPKQNF
ncbi:uncharacterized protein ACDP82_000385 [Pangshura tecta]